MYTSFLRQGAEHSFLERRHPAVVYSCCVCTAIHSRKCLEKSCVAQHSHLRLKRISQKKIVALILRLLNHLFLF